MFRDSTADVSKRVIAVEARKWAAIRSDQPSDVNQGQPSQSPPILRPIASHAPHCSADTEPTGAPHSPPTVGEVCDSANEYASHWENKILPKLPRAFQHVNDSYQIYKAYQTAAVVLASADLSDTLRGSHLALSLEHRKRSHGYYEATLRILADKASTSEACGESGMRMAALLLLAVYELTWATVRGCTIHLREADKIVAAWCTDHPPHWDESWCRLICAWAFVRAHVSVDCSPWESPPSFATAFQGTVLQEQIRGILETSASTGEMMMPLLSDCCRLSTFALLSYTIGWGSSNGHSHIWTEAVRKFNLPAPADPPREVLDKIHLHSLLEVQRRRLDMWHDALPVDRLPFMRFTSMNVDSSQDGGAALRIIPVFFHSHSAAMDYLRYACAQLMCSTSIAMEAPYSTDGNEISPWAVLIAQVVAGLDTANCIEENKFQLSVSWVLFKALLLCRNSKFAAWVERWLQSVDGHGVTRENLIPIRMILRTVRLARTLLQCGRQPVQIFVSANADSEKQELYADRCSISILVIGVESTTGELFSSIIEDQL